MSLADLKTSFLALSSADRASFASFVSAQQNCDVPRFRRKYRNLNDARKHLAKQLTEYVREVGDIFEDRASFISFVSPHLAGLGYSKGEPPAKRVKTETVPLERVKDETD